jgi:hypothetical protein
LYIAICSSSLKGQWDLALLICLLQKKFKLPFEVQKYWILHMDAIYFWWCIHVSCGNNQSQLVLLCQHLCTSITLEKTNGFRKFWLCREEFFKLIDDAKSKITGQWDLKISHLILFPSLAGWGLDKRSDKSVTMLAVAKNLCRVTIHPPH